MRKKLRRKTRQFKGEMVQKTKINLYIRQLRKQMPLIPYRILKVQAKTGLLLRKKGGLRKV